MGLVLKGVPRSISCPWSIPAGWGVSSLSLILSPPTCQGRGSRLEPPNAPRELGAAAAWTLGHGTHTASGQQEGPTQRQGSKRDPHTELLAHPRAKAGRADPPSEEDRGLGKGGVWLRQVFQGLGPQHQALGSI